MMAAPPPARRLLLRETVTAAREPRLPTPLAAPLRLPHSHWPAAPLAPRRYWSDLPPSPPTGRPPRRLAGAGVNRGAAGSSLNGTRKAER